MLTFPSNLAAASADSMILMTAYSWDPKNFKAGRNPDTVSTNVDSKTHIALPIPKAGLNLEDKHNFEQVHGVADLQDFARTAITGFATSFMDSIKLSKMGGKLSDYAQREQFINRRRGNAYRGNDLRKFTFRWEFIPENQDDANKLKEIVDTLRYWSNPDYSSNDDLIAYPCYWILNARAFGKPLFKYDALMIEKLMVNHDDESGTTFFYDGKPVKTSLDIQFTEVASSGRELFGRSQ